MTRLGKLLEGIAGINPAVLGEKTLGRAVRERMSACKLTDEEQYLEHARSSSREMEALIEAVIVPETSFFRDKGPFTFLGQYVRNEWMPKRGARPLRILSAPCSSGEEPYSIAMVLQEAGLKAGDYKIDALDISRTLLGKAERAVYGPHSFRGVPEPLRDRYFVPMGRESVLRDTVRHGVHFMHANLLDDLILAGRRPYDTMFCRNLLIYLGAEARARLVKNIERLVVREGLVFVGHAETSCFAAARFEPLHDRRAFGFRRVEVSAEEFSAGAAMALLQTVSSPPAARIAPRVPGEKDRPAAQTRHEPKSKSSFEAARQLADQGRLPEAAAMCEQLLVEDAVNAEVYCLLGAVLHGLGNLRHAEECFNRAVYLDERCYDAVVHLSLIKEHRGDSAGAEVLRRRAARIRPQARTS
jgi:chemotaxis protein methyltransferase WspC